MNTVKLTLVVALTSALVACGGGGSSGSTPSSSSSALPVTSSSTSSIASSSASSISSSPVTSSSDAPSSSAQSSETSSDSSSSDGPVSEQKTWGFNAAAYSAIPGFFTADYKEDNNIVSTSDDPRFVDGIIVFLNNSTALRFRGHVTEGVADHRWNFNGASWAGSNSGTITAPAVGADMPALRAYIGIPVETGREFTLLVNWQQSGTDTTAGKIVLSGSDGKVLYTLDAFEGSGAITYSAAAGHNLDHIKISYSREGASGGGLHIGDVVLTHVGEVVPPVTSSSSSDASSAVSSISSSVDTSSNGSSHNSSAENSSSSGSDPGGVREAKIEGFAAYHNVTGGQGGPVYLVSTGTELNQALCGSRNGNRTAPVVILVNGTINHGNTTAQGCDTQASVIEIKKTSNISIIGVGNNALFDQIGIHVRDASNIIIQNVHIRNVKKSGSPISNGGDAIGMETNVDRVWIDHNWLEASGGEKDGYDSLLDMKAGVTNVTVSYNLFNDSSRGGLIGSSDSDNKNNNITFHHNWYKNIEQRTPLIRHATVHMYNNYWSNENRAAMIHGINSRMTASALVESNYFQNVNNPLLASTDSSQAGCWQTNNDNTLVDYIYTRTVANGQAHAIPEIVDGQMQSTCAVSVPYTVEMDAAADVPAIVMANAGVGKIDVDTTGAVPVPDGGGGSSSSGSSSSSPSGVIEPTDLPISEGFNGVVDFFSAAYRSLASTSAPFYHRGGGTPSFTNDQLTLTGARFTLGNTRPTVNTASGDTETYGELDLSQPYRISFCVRASSGSGNFQVMVNNNGTSAGNSIHGSLSRIFSAGVGTLAVGERLVIDSAVGNANSFIQLRTESSATVVIDDFWIGYQDDTDSEPEAASCTLYNI